MPAVLVRSRREMDGVCGLVIPGGESTTLLKLARDFDLLAAIDDLHARGAPILGTCAGAILVARRVIGPEQESLGLIDITIERNAYGRQKDSFETTVSLPEEAARWTGGDRSPMDLVFIRAPRIRSCEASVDVMLRLAGEPILVRQEGVIACTFHPEMSADRRVHAFFCAEAAGTPRPASSRGGALSGAVS